jgi:hypothetical protein
MFFYFCNANDINSKKKPTLSKNKVSFLFYNRDLKNVPKIPTEKKETPQIPTGKRGTFVPPY